MVTLKCDICGKSFLTHDDKEQFIVCDDCKASLDSDREEVGDENGNS
jgi:hypothetical protein